MADIYLDIDGKPYSGGLLYYQPECPDGTMIDKNGEERASFEVWKNKQTCQELFPNMNILEFSGDDIEQPRFVD